MKDKDLIYLLVGMLFVASLIIGAAYLKVNNKVENKQEDIVTIPSFINNVEGSLICYASYNETDYSTNIAYGYVFENNIPTEINYYTKGTYNNENYYNLALYSIENETNIYKTTEGIVATYSTEGNTITSNYTYDLKTIELPMEIKVDEYTTISFDPIIGSKEEIINQMQSSVDYKGFSCIER